MISNLHDYRASLYLRNDIIAVDGILSGRELMVALWYIFPDEMFDDLAFRNVQMMAAGNVDYSFDIVIDDGKIDMNLSDDLVNVLPIYLDEVRDDWGPVNTSLTEFKIYVRK